MLLKSKRNWYFNSGRAFYTLCSLLIFSGKEVQCRNFDHNVIALPWHSSRNVCVIFNPMYTLITNFGFETVLAKTDILHSPLKRELETCLCYLPGLVSGWNMSLTSLETMSAFEMIAKSGSFPY